MFAFGLAFAVIGRLDRRVDHLGVSLRGKYLLTDNYRAADRAMFTFGKSCLGAGRLNSGVNYLSMPLCCNITGFVMIAVLTIPLLCSLFSAGRNFGLRPFAVVMTLCRYCRLGNESFSALGTVLAFGKSCLSTCRSLCRIYDLRISLCCNITSLILPTKAPRKEARI